MTPSVFSLDQFEQNIRDYFVGNSVGFAYAINQDGVTVRSDGWGDARTDTDGQEDFTADTKMTSASVAKTITATAILKILQDTPGVGVDSFISPYLPSAWLQGPNINTITFRELLTHQAGLRRVDWDGSASDGNGPDWNNDGFDDEDADLQEQTWYSGLQQLIALGIVPADSDGDGVIEPLDADGNGQIDRKETFSYENADFALMRVMTAYLLGNGDAADNAEEPAQYTADAYVAYVRDNVLAPMGINDADTKPSDDTPTLTYPYPAGDTPGNNWGDRTLYAGGEGWWLSANDYAKFLIGLRGNDDVLSESTRQLMRDNFFGFMDPDHNYGFSQGMYGTYYGHGGDLNNLNTFIMDFPNGVQVALLVNCDWGPVVPHGDAYQGELLKRAFENAWPDLSIAGANYQNEFEVRTNLDDSNAIDIFVNGQLIVTRWIESFDSLTILGTGGVDILTVDDAGGIGETYSIRGIDNGELPLDGIIDWPMLTSGNLFLYDGIEHLVLKANADPNQIEIEGITAGMTVDVYAGDGDDTISVSNLASLVTVSLFGEGGNDTFDVWDVTASASIDIQGDFPFGAGSDDRVIVGHGDLSTVKGIVTFDGSDGADSILLDDSAASAGGNFWFESNSILDPTFGADFDVQFSSVEYIRLDGSAHDDRINVESLSESADLELFGNDGDDIFTVADISENVDQVTGAVVIHGGSGEARNRLPGVLGPEDDDRLYVLDDQNTEPGDFVIDLEGDNLHGRLWKLGEERGVPSLNVIYDQVERTELHTDDGDNTIVVFAAPWFNQVSVSAGGGNDSMDVESSPPFTPAMQIFAGDGDDTIRLSPTAQNLGDLRSPVSIDGSDGHDILWAYDAASAEGESYELDSASLTRNDSAGFTYTALEELTMYLTEADDSFLVNATATGTSVSVFANAGDDVFAVGRRDVSSNIRGDLLVHGGFGDDRLIIDDGEGTPGTHSLSADTYTKSTATGIVGFQFVQDVRLETGAGGDAVDVLGTSEDFDLAVNTHDGNDTIRVQTVHKGTTLTIDTGRGNDGIEVAPTGHVLDAIGDNLVLHGGIGTDTVTVNDQNNLGNDNYAVTTNQVSKPNFLLLYDGMESLTLNAGAGDNTINIENTLPSTRLFVNAGAGNDTIRLSPTAMALGQIRGFVTVNGQGGKDSVLAHDEAFALGATYTLSRTKLGRPGFGGLEFATIEGLRLNVGPGDNTVNVTEFNGDVLFSLFGNVGADTFNVTVRPSELVTGGRLFINGGDGDVLNVLYATKPEVAKKPKVHHDQDPLTHSGTITVDYEDLGYLFQIDYVGVETVDIDKA